MIIPAATEVHGSAEARRQVGLFLFADTVGFAPFTEQVLVGRLARAGELAGLARFLATLDPTGASVSLSCLGKRSLDPQARPFLRTPASWIELLDQRGMTIGVAPNLGFAHAYRRISDHELENTDSSRLEGVAS